MIAAALAAGALLGAAGHLVRDGWPAFGSTHAARALGAALCGLGAVPALGLEGALLFGAAILAGFYNDQKHGEGQRARGLEDLAPLLGSGASSLVPLAFLALGARSWGAAAAVLAVAVLKPALWFAAWRVPGLAAATWLYPTRAAALVFGALVGALAAALAAF